MKNEEPYLCHVLPESSLETIFPSDDDYQEKVNSTGGIADAYSCGASAGSQSGFSYGQYQSDTAEEMYAVRMSENPPNPKNEKRLPSRMGEGWYTPRWPGNRTEGEPGSGAWVYWRCDSRPELTIIGLDSGTPVEGRDPSKDIIRLMEIVQQRYSELNGDCKIRPPAKDVEK